MKKCPFCAEEIQDEAIKFKHCGEWLEKDAKDSPPQVVEVKKIEPSEAQPQVEVVSPEPDEEINRKKEAGLKQCPTCGKWDVYRAFIEDGGQGDWCPNCKKSINPPQSGSNERPWVRYWARKFDYFVFMIIVTIIGYVLAPKYMDHIINGPEFYLIFFAIFIWIFIEAALLSTWGTTPGKWILKVSVLNRNNNKLNYQEAFSRAISVWFNGLGMAIPFVTFFTLIIAANKLTSKGITSWDKNGGFIVSHKTIGPLRIIIVTLFFLLILSLDILEKITKH